MMHEALGEDEHQSLATRCMGCIENLIPTVN